MAANAHHHGREYRCYHSLNGKTCGRLVLRASLTADSWIETYCPKCKRPLTYPRPE